MGGRSEGGRASSGPGEGASSTSRTGLAATAADAAPSDLAQRHGAMSDALGDGNAERNAKARPAGQRQGSRATGRHRSVWGDPLGRPGVRQGMSDERDDLPGRRRSAEGLDTASL